MLLGPPGSGKGTQGEAVSRRFGIPVISSGELLRARVAEGQSVPPVVAAQQKRGELVSDDLVLGIVRDAIARAGRGYILDGFPRTLAQAERDDTPPVDAVIHLDVPDDDVRERLARRAREGRADDADTDVVERRLRRYHGETEPLLDYYRRLGILTTVDASQPPEKVTAAILDALPDDER
jgi:adenylate kinase